MEKKNTKQTKPVKKPYPAKAEKKEEKAPRELGKVTLERAGTMLSPVPAVVVSCGTMSEDANMLTIAWAGTVNSTPPMVSVSVRRERFSHDLIARSGEFVINLPSQDLVKKVDWVGVKSGRDVDKWAETGWTQEEADLVSCPLIKEFPINLECKVTQTIELPSHDMFLAEIVRVHIREDLVDGKGQFHPEWAHLVSFSHGKYFGMPKTSLLKIGESVMKPKTEKRIENERKAKRRNARRK